MTTLDYYKDHANEYVNTTFGVDFRSLQDHFLSLLEPGAAILDFGCGSGRDAKYFGQMGYQVEAMDGSPELARLASDLTGIPVKCQLFQELDEEEKYDGIWACASILHLPKKELHEVLLKMERALKPDGIIYTSFKYGSFEGEREGRFFSDFTEKSFQKFLWQVESDLTKEAEDERLLREGGERKAIRIREAWVTGDAIPGREVKWLNLILQKGKAKIMGEKNFYQEFENLVKKTGVSSVVVLGHMNPDGDAAGSVFGLSHYLKAYYPDLQIYPYMPDPSEKGIRIFLGEEALFDKAALPKEPYLVILCDTAIKERAITEEVLENAVASMGIDHHRSNEYYCDINHVRFAESCSELILGLLCAGEKEKLMACLSEGPAPTAGDYFYMGILHDTAVFTRANPSTFQMASLLLESGVSHRNVMRTWETQTLGELLKQNSLIAQAKTVADGKIAYLVKTYEESQAEGITYDDIHHISNYLRNCADVVAAFTMYEQEPGYWRCSLRSDGCIVDANQVFGRFGGGGHKGAAGLRIRVGDAMEIKDQLLEILVGTVLCHGKRPLP